MAWRERSLINCELQETGVDPKAVKNGEENEKRGLKRRWLHESAAKKIFLEKN